MRPAAGSSVSTQPQGEGTCEGRDSQMPTDGPVRAEPDKPSRRADSGNEPGVWKVIQNYLYIIECLLYASHFIFLDPSVLFCTVTHTHQRSLRPPAPSLSDCPVLPLKYGAIGFQGSRTSVPGSAS